MKGTLKIRTASVGDANELLEIYAPYVEKTAITFETEVPSLKEFKGRIEKISAKYPYLILFCDEEPVGYAYASEFKGRAAYDWSVETTIYLKWDKRGEGYGHILLEALENALREQNFLNANACIAWARSEDEYLTNASAYFHEKNGYKMVGTFHDSGYKFNHWYDMVWMEKMLGEHPTVPKPLTLPQNKSYTLAKK
ncbi:MAG: GNAT family N-acetyltransferase [Lachnospiraceae bacterium]|nr:GNAT family N-acetyltransferase [Lachnospiraceae bacterium]